ncbi:protein-L-isoaspartate O-methyltransferase [Cellulomonas sp. KRMCY2]|uniref:protein-L-isoaspartate O-methyltransferase family protein n=1 Tax=Cellulomonas sp. KRMCY2 TaxID=1304865 RepID=UPI00045E60FC|nr:class I SAM-dependent methyltransferase [Cellulomonas sp. KRMCY2]
MSRTLPPRDRVDEAFDALPRRLFLPARERAHAHEDRPIVIGHGQTSSQPSTVATMLRLLDVHRGAKVLDVGAGSGWTTALLAHLVGPTGTVLGVELEPELASWGEANLAATDQPWASIEPVPPGVLGAPQAAPFDRVLVSAEAREVPAELVGQLTGDGRMVAPVAGGLSVVQRGPDRVTVTRFEGYQFVPLR